MKTKSRLWAQTAAIAVAIAAAAASPATAQTTPPPAAAQAPAQIAVGSGATMVPPEGWTVSHAGAVVRYAPPEQDVTFAVVPIASAKDGADAVVQAWKLVRPDFARPVRITQPIPARDGWDGGVVVNYDVPPAEQKVAQGMAFRKGNGWTVVTIEGALATLAKRGAQLNASAQSLRPANFTKESFAGRRPHPLDAARIAKLRDFIRSAMTTLNIPGAGVAVIDHGAIVWEGGIGVKQVETGTPVDKDTLFMIASNTKGMSTLLLAELVDQGKLDWNRPVTDYMPNFRLGSDATTKKVLVRHLVCACTGLPRKDMQWLFNTAPGAAASDTFTQLAATTPTSGFGEVFQYNNLMASAAGYLGAHIVYPDMELGAAYDKAMQTHIFDALGMRHTTLSTPRAMAGDWARPYGLDLDGHVAPIDVKFNDTIAPYRPAGGAWSSAHDMALYVLDELNQGKLPGGGQLVSPTNLLARRVHNVPIGENAWYGMGLMDNASTGVSVIQHGGSLFGYKSNWFAIPSAGVGLVVLTNSDDGDPLTSVAERYLLELLYDGKPEAAEDVALIAKRSAEGLAKARSEIIRPVSAEAAQPYLGHYANADLGPLTVGMEHGTLMLRATSIWSEAAMRKNKDGTVSLIMVTPGVAGLGFLATTQDTKRALVLNDGQHQYVFTEVGGGAGAKSH